MCGRTSAPLKPRGTGRSGDREVEVEQAAGVEGANLQAAWRASMNLGRWRAADI